MALVASKPRIAANGINPLPMLADIDWKVSNILYIRRVKLQWQA
jgi:hypothetical protein